MTDRLSLISFFRQYPTEQKSEQFFINLRWKNGIICPFCGKNRIANMKDKQPMPYRCKDCRKFFSVRTGTILTESKLPFQKWLLAIYILTNSKKGVSSIQLAEYLETTQKTAWFLGHRIREVWSQDNTKLGGIIEVDETYIGGLEKNKHNSDKLNAGHGVVGKIPVVGIKSCLGQTKAEVVEYTDSKTLKNIVFNNIELNSVLNTDQHRGYSNLDIDFNHKVVNHSVGEYVKGMAYTNGIESFWSLLKRGYYGIYHFWSKKHLQKYINEFVYRQNVKDLDSRTRTVITAVKGRNCNLKYKELING